MAGRGHSRKSIREALAAAEDAGFTVIESSVRGHSWGFIVCPDCEQRHPVKSTPKNDDNDKRRILAFPRRHQKEHR